MAMAMAMEVVCLVPRVWCRGVADGVTQRSQWLEAREGLEGVVAEEVVVSGGELGE